MTQFVTTSVSLPRSTHERLRRRVTKYGDRSKVIARLLEMFLDGQVKVVLPAREIPSRRL